MSAIDVRRRRGSTDSASQMLVLLAVLLLSLCSGAAQAQERGPLVGIWKVEDDGNPHYLTMTVATYSEGPSSVVDPTPGAAVSYFGVRRTKAGDVLTTQGALESQADGSFKSAIGQRPTVNYILRPTDDPDLITGVWIVDGKDGPIQGFSAWRRQPPLKTNSVSHQFGSEEFDPVPHGVRPTKIELNYSTNGYPNVVIWLRGERFAGGHQVRTNPGSGISHYHLGFTEPRYLCDGKGTYPWHTQWWPCSQGAGSPDPLSGAVLGLYLHFSIRKDATPGIETFWIDGQPVPLELVIQGYPEPTLPELISLQALDRNENPLKVIIEAVPFALRAIFDDDHPDEWISVEVPTAAPEGYQVRLKRTEDHNVFRSVWLVVEAAVKRQ